MRLLRYAMTTLTMLVLGVTVTALSSSAPTSMTSTTGTPRVAFSVTAPDVPEVVCMMLGCPTIDVGDAPTREDGGDTEFAPLDPAPVGFATSPATFPNPPDNETIAPSPQDGECFDQPWIPAYIVTRESGGDPYIINGGAHAASPYESGGRSWGCFQFLPSTWDANCADLGFTVGEQIECARRVSSDGTNLNPWRL